MSYYEKRVYNKKVPNSISKMIFDRVVGKGKGLPMKHEVFSKSNILIKYIPILVDNRPIEKATFSTLQQLDFIAPWEESDWKTFFEEVTFIYIAYIGKKDGKELGNGYRILDRVFKVTFSTKEVEDFGKTYNMIKKAIETKDVTKLPNASLNSKKEIGLKLVISTKSQGNRGKKYERFIEDGTRETCFMLNKDFIHRKFNDAVTLRGDVKVTGNLTSISAELRYRKFSFRKRTLQYYDI